MKIGLIDNDLVVRERHNFPNLAIMKLSNYHKSKGDTVKLIGFNEIEPNSLFSHDYDLIYISKAFTDSYTPDYIFKIDNIKIGGTGFYFDKAEPLPYEIEHTMPDYAVYDKIIHTIKKKSFYQDYSIGYTTRGCFRHCPFCVNKNLNKVNLHSPFDEFYDSSRPKLAMLDDNLLGLGNKDLYKIFDRLGEINKPFQYRQALDIRLLTEERIKRLLELRYDGNYYFAFDLWGERKKIIPKMELFERVYNLIKRKSDNHSKFIQSKMYLFTGLDEGNIYDLSFWINDLKILFERIKICFNYGFAPYIMRYHTVDKSPYRKVYQDIATWTNHPRLIVSTASLSEFMDDGSFGTNDIKEFFMNHNKDFKKYINLKLI